MKIRVAPPDVTRPLYRAVDAVAVAVVFTVPALVLRALKRALLD